MVICMARISYVRRKVRGFRLFYRLATHFREDAVPVTILFFRFGVAVIRVQLRSIFSVTVISLLMLYSSRGVGVMSAQLSVVRI